MMINKCCFRSERSSRVICGGGGGGEGGYWCALSLLGLNSHHVLSVEYCDYVCAPFKGHIVLYLYLEYNIACAGDIFPTTHKHFQARRRRKLPTLALEV